MTHTPSLVQRLVFDVTPWRTLFLATPPTDLLPAVWSRYRTEAFRFDTYEEADVLAKKMRAEGDTHVHAVVLNPASDPRRPVQMQLVMLAQQQRRREAAEKKRTHYGYND